MQLSCIYYSPSALKRRFSGWWNSLLKGVTLTVDELKGFLKQMDENSEFDNIQLDAFASAFVPDADRTGRY